MALLGIWRMQELAREEVGTSSSSSSRQPSRRSHFSWTMRAAGVGLASRLATILACAALDYFLEDFDTSAGLGWPACHGDFRPADGTWGADYDPDRGDGGIHGSLAAAVRSSVVWDGVHFVRVCQCGYEFDHQIAFLPLWPRLMRATSRVVVEPLLRWTGAGFEIGRAMGCALSGLLLSNLCFVVSVACLFRLARRLGFGNKLAMRACLIYALNPATVFYSSIYTESLYNLLHFEALVHLFTDEETRGTIFVSTACLAAATCARSNGILSACLVLAMRTRAWLKASKGGGGPLGMGKLLTPALAKQAAMAITQCLAIVAPFWLYQIHFQSAWCSRYREGASEFIGAGESPAGMDGDVIKGMPQWCEGSSWVPKVYSHVQAQYWNVGLFKFYEFEQIPNFLLALPIWASSLFCLSEAFSGVGILWRDLGSWRGAGEVAASVVLSDLGVYGQVVLCLHWAVMVAVTCAIMNVQVSTRFLSTCAPLYLMVAHLTQKKGRERQAYWILGFFATYAGLGCILFPNHYPWV